MYSMSELISTKYFSPFFIKAFFLDVSASGVYSEIPDMLYCGLKIEVAFNNTSKSITFPRVQVSKRNVLLNCQLSCRGFSIPVSVQSVSQSVSSIAAFGSSVDFSPLDESYLTLSNSRLILPVSCGCNSSDFDRFDSCVLVRRVTS